MADALIETNWSNPYSSIVSDTTDQINQLDSNIQSVLAAISKLEQMNPTSAYLPQLKNRLAELQSKMWKLNKQNESAKSLLNSYNESLVNTNTMQGIYQLKQAELNRAQLEADESYRKMYEDVRRKWSNYINALWNATASENAIINANAWRYWASVQSTAEARARNYLQNAQAQAEYDSNLQAQLNAIEENRLNSNAWYVQLSQSNADNTLRQDIMNNLSSSSSWSWWWRSRWWSSKNVTLPDTSKNEAPKWTTDWTSWWWWESTDWRHYKDFAASQYTAEQNRAWTYWVIDSDVVHYQSAWNEKWTMNNWRFSDNIANLDKDKVNAAVEKINKQYWEDFDTKNADWWITNGWYVVLTNTYKDTDWTEKVKQRAIPIEEVSDWNYYINRDWKKVYFK